MKRITCIFLSIVAILNLFFFDNTTEAFALGFIFGGDSLWTKEYYTDIFGDKTNEYYLTNSKHLKGTYNKKDINKGKLGADIVIERKGENAYAYIILFEKGKDQLKNSTEKDISYDISVKRTDGSQYTTEGVLYSGSDRIRVYSSIDLTNALSSQGEISIYIEETQQAINNYLFKAECGNFGELFKTEIIIPYKEEQYQQAEKLLQNKKYDEAIDIFTKLGDFKDSTKRIEEVLEAKNSSAYTNAEALLEAKDFNGAIAVFLSLEDYLDSKDRAEKTSNLAVEYARSLAKDLLFDEALAVLESVKQYIDITTEVLEVKYSKACYLMNSVEYESLPFDTTPIISSLKLFDEIGEYKDSKTLHEQGLSLVLENTYTIGQEYIKAKDYHAAAEIFDLIMDYKDSAELALGCISDLLKESKSKENLEFVGQFFNDNTSWYTQMTPEEIESVFDEKYGFQHWEMNGKSYSVKKYDDQYSKFGSDNDYLISFEYGEYREYDDSTLGKMRIPRSYRAFNWYQLSEDCFAVIPISSTHKIDGKYDIWYRRIY